MRIKSRRSSINNPTVRVLGKQANNNLPFRPCGPLVHVLAYLGLFMVAPNPCLDRSHFRVVSSIAKPCRPTTPYYNVLAPWT